MPNQAATQTNDDWFPLDPQEHARQVRALTTLLGRKPKRVLDLGIGDARAAEPLVRQGHSVMGIDRDPAAVRACAEKGIPCIKGDFASPGAGAGAGASSLWKSVGKHGRFDAAVCVGNTFLLVSSPAAAVALLQRLAACLKPGAPLVLDDFTPLWREVGEGYWQEGMSEDSGQQLVWSPGDNVLALRRGKAVKPRGWKITKGDTLMRLWSKGELSLLALAAGWTMPDMQPRGLTVMHAPRAGSAKST